MKTLLDGTKLSPVFPPEVKPYHVGVYIASVNKKGVIFYRRWDGEDWYYGDTDKEAAARSERKWPKAAPLWWRGLEEDPNKKAENGLQA